MIEFLFSTLGLINPQIFIFSILIFFIGYGLAPTAYYKNINWLIAYPMWLSGKLEHLSKKSWNPYLLFLFLLSVNSVSLFLTLLSGLLPILPFAFAAWTGLNIGVVTYHTLKGQLFYTALINPVAMFELPAAFLTFTMAFQNNLSLLNITIIEITPATFGAYINLFFWLVIPLLILAGILETFLIIYARKFENDSKSEDEK